MKRALLYTYHTPLLTAIFWIVMAVPNAASQNQIPSSKKALTLEVAYDPATSLLSIHARQTPLGKILEEISKKASLTIDSSVEELLQEQVSVEIKSLPFEQAIKKLLEGFSSAFFYSEMSDTGSKDPTPRLARITLLSRRPSTTVEELRVITVDPPKDAKRANDPQGTLNQGAELVQALIDNKPSAKGIIENLKVPGSEKEREKAAEAVLEMLSSKDLRAYYGALDALKELARERAVDFLVNWLQGDNQEMRVVAATGLGYLGDEIATDPLVSALAAQDPSTRQVAAGSLARIGGERAMGILFKTYLTGDLGLKQAVVAAIASHGDEKSQEHLANIISAGKVSKGATPQEVISSSLAQDDSLIGR